MTTSGAISGLLTAGDICKTAYELLGIVKPEESLTAVQSATGLKHLNWMLKSMQSDGCNLWRDQDVSIAWPANTSDGVLDTNLNDVFDVRYSDGNGYERLLTRWERTDYNQLPNKATPGLPTIYSLARERGDLKMRIWPVPTTTITLLADASRIIEDVTASGQTLDLPQEWTECVFYNLADRLANVDGITDRVGPLKAEIGKKAAGLYASLSNFDRPGSVFLRPSP